MDHKITMIRSGKSKQRKRTHCDCMMGGGWEWSVGWFVCSHVVVVVFIQCIKEWWPSGFDSIFMMKCSSTVLCTLAGQHKVLLMIHTSNHSNGSHFHDSIQDHCEKKKNVEDARTKKEKKERTHEWMDERNKWYLVICQSIWNFEWMNLFVSSFVCKLFNSAIFGLYLHCFAHVLSYTHSHTHTKKMRRANAKPHTRTPFTNEMLRNWCVFYGWKK